MVTKNNLLAQRLRKIQCAPTSILLTTKNMWGMTLYPIMDLVTLVLSVIYHPQALNPLLCQLFSALCSISQAKKIYIFLILLLYRESIHDKEPNP